MNHISRLFRQTLSVRIQVFLFAVIFLAASLIFPCIQAVAQTSVSVSVGIKQTACATSSVQDAQNSNNTSSEEADGTLSVSPNPSNNGQIVIEIDVERNNVPQGATILLRLLSTRGEAACQEYTSVLVINGGKWRKTVNIEHLAQGAYLLTLEAGTRKWSRKIVIT